MCGEGIGLFCLFFLLSKYILVSKFPQDDSVLPVMLIGTYLTHELLLFEKGELREQMCGHLTARQGQPTTDEEMVMCLMPNTFCLFRGTSFCSFQHSRNCV